MLWFTTPDSSIPIPLKMAQEVCTDVFTRIDTNLTDNHNKQRLST